MLRHVDIGSFHQSKLKANQRYYINNEHIRINKYTFDETIIGNNLQLKFIIYGLKNNETIDLIYDEEIYQLNNTPFELNYTYKENKNDLFYFKVGEEIEVIAAEIIVGFLPENINIFYKQINYTESFGTFLLEEEKGLIIKVPRDLDEDLFDFSIIYPGRSDSNIFSNNFDIQIAYDKIEFLSIFNYNLANFPSVIPLFKINPYNEIKKYSSLENNKYLYILIFNKYNSYESRYIYIKKPMPYSDVKLNKINILPQLSGNNNKYYYQIKIPEPEEGYNYFWFKQYRQKDLF